MRARLVLMSTKQVSISLVFILLAALSLSAQTFRGTILGTVTDPSGAVVANATVAVRQAARHQRFIDPG